jgi:uncharacterized OsmC-like protein
MDAQTLRQIQTPLKQQYRDDPATAVVTMAAAGVVQWPQIACSVDTSLGKVTAGLHPAAGGDGLLSCSGDMLLQSLVACSGVTLAAVATALGMEIRSAAISARADLDFRGTLGIEKSVPVGLTRVTLDFLMDSPCEDSQLDKLIELCERYCVVWQSLASSVERSTTWRRV